MRQSTGQLARVLLLVIIIFTVQHPVEVIEAFIYEYILTRNMNRFCISRNQLLT